MVRLDFCPRQGQIQKIQKEGTNFPSPPPPQMKTSLSGHAAYSTVGVLVMQSKVMLTFRANRIKEDFIIQFSKQNRSVSGRKKGACSPLGPSPKSTYARERKTLPKGSLYFVHDLYSNSEITTYTSKRTKESPMRFPEPSRRVYMYL